MNTESISKTKGKINQPDSKEQPGAPQPRDTRHTSQRPLTAPATVIQQSTPHRAINTTTSNAKGTQPKVRRIVLEDSSTSASLSSSSSSLSSSSDPAATNTRSSQHDPRTVALINKPLPGARARSRSKQTQRRTRNKRTSHRTTALPAVNRRAGTGKHITAPTNFLRKTSKRPHTGLLGTFAIQPAERPQTSS